MEVTLTTQSGKEFKTILDLKKGVNTSVLNVGFTFINGKNYKGELFYLSENESMVIRPCRNFLNDFTGGKKTVFNVRESKESIFDTAKEFFNAANTDEMRYDLEFNEFQRFNTIANNYVAFYFDNSFDAADFLKKNIKNLPNGFEVVKENTDFDGFGIDSPRYITFDFSSLESERQTILAVPLAKAAKIEELTQRAKETGELQLLDSGYNLVENGEETMNKYWYRYVNQKGEIVPR